MVIRLWTSMTLALGLGLLLLGSPHETLSAESQEALGITKEKTKQGFPYFSGGVGTEEREVLEEWGKAYNLKLSFAEKSGVYLSDVRVVIEGAKGEEIISTTTNGPWFYIDLPDGTYRVKATFKDKTKEVKTLRLQKGKAVRQTLIWDLGEQS